MANAIEIPIQVGVLDSGFEVITPEEITFTIDELTLLHINTGDMPFSPVATVYRKVQMVKGCSMQFLCTMYGETCSNLFLPPGIYEVEICDDNGAKYTPNGIYDISLVLEPVSNTYALAEQLNSGC